MASRMRWLVVALAALSGCAGKNFTTSPNDGSDGGSGTGGSSGSSGSSGKGGSKSGTGGSGGAGAETGAGGEGDVGGAAGAGGDAPCTDTTECSEGRYCNAAGVCTPCTDISSLADPTTAVFGEPEALSLVNDSATDYFFRFPRSIGSGTAITYVRDFFGGELWLTADPTQDVGAPLPSPINEPDSFEGSGLWLGFDALAPRNYIFNTVPGSSGRNTMYAAELASNGTASNLMRMPAPFNADEASLESSYSMAVSKDRAWWMVNRDQVLDVHFYTAPLDGSAPPSVVVLELGENCTVNDFDFAAWVTPDGKLMFATVSERDESCATLPNQRTDIVLFKLGASGQPSGPGIMMPGLSAVDFSETDASLSTDMCWLYYSAQQESGQIGLMRARRWQ